MLPIVLVLLVASSALAAPSVNINQYSINEIAPRHDSGVGVSSALLDRLFELSDNAEMNIYTLSSIQVINDLADQPDPYSQAVAVAQAIAVLGQIGHGITGDSCAAASAINEYASGRGSRGYLTSLASSIDTIAQLATNPGSLRYSTGPRGGCAGGGRTYQFEAAWDAILDHASPYNIGLHNEQYCSVKRLFGASNVRSNNIAAAATAAATAAQSVQHAIGPITNFLRAAVNGGNVAQAAASAKAALLG